MSKLRYLAALVAVLFGMAVATPAGATGFRPVNGHIEANFQPQPCPDGSGRVVTWLGTVEIDGSAHGWVEFAGYSRETPHYIYFEERWAIFDVGADGTPDAAEACGPTLIAGDEWGFGFPSRGTAFAVGKVTDSTGFAGVTVGSGMFWRGTVTADPATGVPQTFDARLSLWRHR